eukprot:754408-Hanusia_phi.AAC.3
MQEVPVQESENLCQSEEEKGPRQGSEDPKDEEEYKAEDANETQEDGNMQADEDGDDAEAMI